MQTLISAELNFIHEFPQVLVIDISEILGTNIFWEEP